MDKTSEVPSATPARGTGWPFHFLRAVLVLGLGYCIYLAATQGSAHWYFRRPPPAGLRQAIRLDPGNPQYHGNLGWFLLRSFEHYDPGEAVRLYETAVRLSPARARYWAELGGAYELAGREEDARRAFQRAQQLFPNSPEINWRLGNFSLRAGHTAEALRAFHKTVVGDPKLRRPAFDLAWRAGADPEAILHTMLPVDAGVYFAYLNYLLETRRLDSAARVWSRLLELNLSFELSAAFPYLDALVQERRVADLEAAWAALAERHPARLRRRDFDTNLLTNGDFEDEILNGGLDWRVIPLEGVVVSVDSLTAFDGIRSLKIRFDGRHNLDYAHVFEYVSVRPNTLYRFVAYYRAQGITTESGPRFQLLDPFEPKALFLATEPILRSSSWSPQQLDFRTGPQTRLLLLRLTRPPSHKFDNQIAGTIWIDRLSLTPAE